MLHLHRSASGLALVGGLADLLATPPDDAFAPDLVAVPAQGIERWLAQRLSHRLGAAAPVGEAGGADGVCANVLFPRPDDLLDEAVAAAGPEHAAAVQAWHPDRSAWVLLDLLDELLAAPGDDGFELVRHHLRGVERPGQAAGTAAPSPRRYAVARRLAELFAGYAAARPELVRDWAAGRHGSGDGGAGSTIDTPVPDDLAWQPLLWRRLREGIGVPHPAELLPDALAAIEADPHRLELPGRLSIYGVSRLDSTRISVLAAVTRHRDVHLWLHHASPPLWEALRSHGSAAPVRRRSELPPAARHPLLASLSRDVQELQLRLAALAPERHDSLHESPEPPDTLLGWLQRDLLQDRPPVPAGRQLDQADRSVQVHACHGQARQVEVLREVVLGLLADDRTLQPRDVLVMCPDVETFAPLVAAAFSFDDHPGNQLRVRLADRSPRQVNPLLAVVAGLLDLAAGRVTSSQVLDLASTAPVRRRFGFTEDDVEQLRAWTVAAGAHWGLHAAHRRPWGLGELGQGTWRAAIDRLLTGAAVREAQSVLGGTLPMDGVDSSDVDLAGRFAELLDRLDAAVAALGTAAAASEWLEQLEQCVLDLTDVGYDTAWQLVQLRAELDDIRAGVDGRGTPLGLADARALLEQRLVGRPGRSGFRTGGMTVCTLVPMRSVPHRVVCLLGLDDGAFPRHPLPDGDDLLARDPLIGERDPRSEDRQLFLDAVLAATEHLVVTYAGAHVRSGAELPPAVPLGELLDALDRTATTADGRPVREAVLQRHPLQPFHPKNFEAGGMGRPGPLSFDLVALAGARSQARALADGRQPAAGFLDAPLPPVPAEDVVELSRLAGFWASPAKGFLQQRLELSATGRDEQPEDAVPIELNGLASWQVADRMLAARVRGLDKATIGLVELARGQVPPGPLGVDLVCTIGAGLDRLLDAARPWLEEPAGTVDVDVRLPDGRRLVGAVRDVRGGAALRLTYSRIKAKQRLRAWIELLALSAAGAQPTAVVIGRGQKSRVICCTLGPVPPTLALELLAQLAALRDLGLRTPLPAPVGTAAAYAVARHGGAAAGQAVQQARWEWESTFYEREDAEPEHETVWGRRAPLEVLTGWVPPPDATPVRYDGEPDAFSALACTVWVPLLEHKQERQA